MKQFQDAFAPLHAPRDLPGRVLARAERPRPGRLLRAGMAAALLAAALTVSACAADYILNQREVFFFDTLEALASRQEADRPGRAVSFGVPCTAQESREMETSAQYAARAMEDGLLGEETLISRSQSQDPGRDGWEEQVVRECEDDYYGPVITTYQTSADYAETLPLEGLPAWDLSPLCREMTPEEGAQVLIQGRRPESGELVWAKAHLGYALPQGGRFTLTYSYDCNTDYGTQPEYVLSSAYDQSELYTTQDGCRALVQAYDGQMWASAACGGRMISVYSIGLTLEQVEGVLDELKLSALLFA